MRHLILAAYILFFSTGFLGVAALAIHRVRSKDRILGWLIAFQATLILALALVLAYFYTENILALAQGGSKALSGLFALLSTVLNALLYGAAFGLGKELFPPGTLENPKDSTLRAGLRILPAAVIVQTAASLAFHFLRWKPAYWSVLGYVLTSAAILVFGLGLRRASSFPRFSRLRRLLSGYATCAFAFAPLGAAELLLNEALEGLQPLSLDFLFFLGWNIVSLSSLLPAGREGDKAAATLGLTGREREIAALIAQGLSNKMIASRLEISEATVRTHIYNLFRKAEVGSRVELINRLYDELRRPES
ncbi:MAG: helix-turn-helix transcriptional regulator [Spirochaetota bacterium]